jgi:hypothetical protein
MEWYWIIGGALTGWTFLTLFARERQSQLNAMEAAHSAKLAAQTAPAEIPKAADEVTVVR